MRREILREVAVLSRSTIPTGDVLHLSVSEDGGHEEQTEQRQHEADAEV